LMDLLSQKAGQATEDPGSALSRTPGRHPAAWWATGKPQGIWTPHNHPRAGRHPGQIGKREA
jgi:hypothetical protein